MNVGVGCDENSGVKNEDSKDYDKGVCPFVRRGRWRLFRHGSCSPFTVVERVEL